MIVFNLLAGFLLAFAFCGFLVNGDGNVQGFQQRMDNILMTMRQEFPDRQDYKPFGCQWLGYAYVCVNSGSVGRVSTLKRLSEATYYTRDGSQYVKVYLGLGSLNVQLDTSIKICNLHYYSKIDIDIHFNSLSYEFELGGHSNCYANITDVQVEQFGCFRCLVTGMGVWEGMIYRNVISYLNSYTAQIKQQILQIITPLAKEKFRSINICSPKLTSYEEILSALVSSGVVHNVENPPALLPHNR